MTHRPYQPDRHQSDYDPLPILVYCQLISHRTEVIHEEERSYEVPEKVLMVRIHAHKLTTESVWASLNKYGYFSRSYKLISYWKPIDDSNIF